MKSTLCLRNLHADCPTPNICACECHEGDDEIDEILASVPVMETLDGFSPVWESPPSAAKPVISPEEISLIDAHPGRWRKVRISGKPHGAASVRDRLRKSGQIVWDDYDVKAFRNEEGGSALYIRKKA